MRASYNDARSTLWYRELIGLKSLGKVKYPGVPTWYASYSWECMLSGFKSIYSTESAVLYIHGRGISLRISALTSGPYAGRRNLTSTRRRQWSTIWSSSRSLRNGYTKDKLRKKDKIKFERNDEARRKQSKFKRIKIIVYRRSFSKL